MVKPPVSPLWLLEESIWQPDRNQVWESLCTVANGYLGIRGFPDEPFDAGPTCPGTHIAGIFDPGADNVPELVNVTNFCEVEILLEGEPFHMVPGSVCEYRRTLDLKRGLLRRVVVYAAQGRSTCVEFERFASMANPHLASQLIAVTPLDWRGRVEVRFWLNSAVSNAGKAHLRLLHANHVGRDRILVATETAETRVRIGHACRCHAWVRQSAPPLPRHIGGGEKIGLAYDAILEPGQQASFERVVATCTSRDLDVVSVERNCLAAVADRQATIHGVQRRLHVRRWRTWWNRADVVIDGPAEDQRAVRFAIFHLIQSCPAREPRVSIAAKGLSGEGYRGHVFWDTEIFMVPFFVSSSPASARRLLMYRHHGLQGARRKARAAGYQGAMFPWESADTGDETCPSFVPDPKTGEPVPVLTGQIEDHITADIVYAACQYVRATDDTWFRERFLLEIVVESARFWASRASFNHARQRWEIRNVIGPDEYHERVDNNAYTNFICAWNLRRACREVRRMRDVHSQSRLLRRLAVSEQECRHWLTIADGLFVPRSGNLVENHEGFFRLRNVDPRPLSALVSREPEKTRMRKIQKAQVLKQADVLMLMALFPDEFTDKVKLKNWHYYEPRTTHDSSLSPSVHSIVASDLNLRDKAYEYFRRSAFIDLDDLTANAGQGLHLAAMGGTWQAVVRGFLGLRQDGALPYGRARLPRAWKRVVVRILHRKHAYSLEATRNRVRITRLK